MAKIIDMARDIFNPRDDNVRIPDYVIAEIQEIIRQNDKPIPSSTPLDELCFAVMDVETTGFNHKKGDEIIEVGSVIIEGGVIERDKTFHQLVYPYRHVPDHIHELTGIPREMLVDGLSFFGILQQLLKFIGGNIIVGHNIHFDLGFINPKLKKYYRTRIKNRTIDTITLARSLHIQSKSFSLDNLLAFYGIEPVGRHTALGDAFLTAEVFIRLMAALKKHHISTLAGLDIHLQHHDRSVDAKTV
jgi:DNA polymerase-3 subunit epsilon